MKVAEYRKVQAYISLEEEDAALLADDLAELQGKGKLIVYSHIAHENNISFTARMKNKRAGWNKGVPDYIIVFPNCVLFLELKRTHGGRLSPEQKVWIDNIDGKVARSKVAYGYNDAKKIIDSFLPLENTS